MNNFKPNFSMLRVRHSNNALAALRDALTNYAFQPNAVIDNALRDSFCAAFSREQKSLGIKVTPYVPGEPKEWYANDPRVLFAKMLLHVPSRRERIEFMQEQGYDLCLPSTAIYAKYLLPLYFSIREEFPDTPNMFFFSRVVLAYGRYTGACFDEALNMLWPLVNYMAEDNPNLLGGTLTPYDMKVLTATLQYTLNPDVDTVLKQYGPYLKKISQALQGNAVARIDVADYVEAMVDRETLYKFLLHQVSYIYFNGNEVVPRLCDEIWRIKEQQLNNQ